MTKLFPTFVGIFTSLFLCNMYNTQDMSQINRLKVVLAEKRKTNRWLAEQIGKNENSVSRWCANHYQPSVEVLVEVAKVLDVDVRELFNETKSTK